MAIEDETEDAVFGYTSGIDPQVMNKRAECEGGGHIAGTRFAGRLFFAGTLTGEFRDYGKYPWRWYFLTDLTQKPGNYPGDAVWCEQGGLLILD